MFLVISVNTVKFVPKSKFDNDIQRSLLKQNMNNLIQHNITYVVTNTFVAILTLEPPKFLKLLKKLLFSILLNPWNFYFGWSLRLKSRLITMWIIFPTFDLMTEDRGLSMIKIVIETFKVPQIW